MDAEMEIIMDTEKDAADLEIIMETGKGEGMEVIETETDANKPSRVDVDQLLPDQQTRQSRDEKVDDGQISVVSGPTARGDKDVVKTTRVEKQMLQDEMKFMKDFNPEQRSKKKKMRIFIDPDECDCLIPNCPGCHYFPCKSCSSRCCGRVCRKERRWLYTEIEIQGSGITRKRP